MKKIQVLLLLAVFMTLPLGATKSKIFAGRTGGPGSTGN